MISYILDLIKVTAPIAAAATPMLTVELILH